jgi:hypothetical protein
MRAHPAARPPSDGSPVVGSDDDSGYFAAFEWVAEETGIYRLQVTSFESVTTGVLLVKRF